MASLELVNLVADDSEAHVRTRRISKTRRHDARTSGIAEGSDGRNGYLILGFSHHVFCQVGEPVRCPGRPSLAGKQLYVTVVRDCRLPMRLRVRVGATSLAFTLSSEAQLKRLTSGLDKNTLKKFPSEKLRLLWVLYRRR